MPVCVNVTAGIVSLEITDFAFPGFIPFSLVRSYRSNSTADGPLGKCWGVTVGEEILAYGDHVVLVNGEGRTVRFPAPGPDREPVTNPVEGVQLSYDVETDNGRQYAVFALRVGDGVRRFAQVDASGRFRLIRIEDSHRNAIQFTYRHGRIAEIRDTLERRFFLSHDRDGRLTEVQLVADGAQPISLVRYMYGADGLLAQVVKQSGAVNTYSYSDRLLIAHTDDDGVEFYNAYDAKRRCIRSWRGSGYYAREYFYDHEKFQTLVVDSLGAGTLYRYNEFNLVTETVDARGGVSRFLFDEGNNVVLASNQVDSATMMAYDTGKRPVAIIRADGTSETMAYDDAGRPVQYVNANGGALTAEYNRFGDLVSSTRPGGAITRFEYDARGGTTAIVLDNGQRLVREYGRDFIRFVHDGKPVVERRFDLQGRPVAVVYHGLYTAEFRYDEFGRLAEYVGVGGATRRYSYDAAGRISGFRDDHGGSTVFEYNEVGLRTATQRQGQRTEFRYDTEGRLVEVINSHGESHRVTYDVLGRMIRQHFFDGRWEEYEHDAAGAIRMIRDAAGRETTYEVDPVGRPLIVRSTDGTVCAFAYAAGGAVARAVRDGYAVEFEYDPEGRPVVQRQDSYELRYTYNTMGWLVRVEDSTGRITELERDPLMRVRRLVATGSDPVSPTPFALTFEYDDLNQFARIETATGVAVQRRNNAWRRPTWLRAGMSGGPALEEQFEYDRAGKVMRRSPLHEPPIEYRYDAAGNLVAVSELARDLERYAYDSEINVGSRTTSRDGIVESVEMSYGPGNRLARAGRTEYAYDAAGLTTSVASDAGVTRYTYSDDDLLVRVDDPTRGVTEFRYDALRRRVAKKSGARETRFFWDRQTLWMEEELSTAAGDEESPPATRATSYLFDPGSWSPLALVIDGAGYLAVNDPVGAPFALLDAEGAAVWRMRANIWGQPLAVTQRDGIRCALRFPGQYADDETGLHYNLNRYYDPTTGRFTSPDPIGLLGGANTYLYTGDPLNHADPLGLDCQNFAQGEPPTLYRGDARPPSDICGKGFQPKDPTANISILDHAGGNTKGWVSTSYEPETAKRFGKDDPTKPRYLYIIANPACAANPGHEVDCDPDVQKRQQWFISKGMSPEGSEQEIAFKNVPPRAVLGYVEVAPDGTEGDFKLC